MHSSAKNMGHSCRVHHLQSSSSLNFPSFQRQKRIFDRTCKCGCHFHLLFFFWAKILFQIAVKYLFFCYIYPLVLLFVFFFFWSDYTTKCINAFASCKCFSISQMQVLMEFVSSSAGNLSAWLGMDLTFYEAISFLLLSLNACKVLIITSLLPHPSLL